MDHYPTSLKYLNCSPSIYLDHDAYSNLYNPISDSFYTLKYLEELHVLSPYDINFMLFSHLKRVRIENCNKRIDLPDTIEYLYVNKLKHNDHLIDTLSLQELCIYKPHVRWFKTLQRLTIESNCGKLYNIPQTLWYLKCKSQVQFENQNYALQEIHMVKPDISCPLNLNYFPHLKTLNIISSAAIDNEPCVILNTAYSRIETFNCLFTDYHFDFPSTLTSLTINHWSNVDIVIPRGLQQFILNN